MAGDVSFVSNATREVISLRIVEPEEDEHVTSAEAQTISEIHARD